MASSLVRSGRSEAMPWIRDLALVGGASAVGAPMAAVILGGESEAHWVWAYVAAAGLAGLLTGALLGWLTPRLLARGLARWPRIGFIFAGVAVGAAWGALVGAAAGAAGLVAGHTCWNDWTDFAVAMAGSAVLAAPFAALQLGWFWVAAATRRARRRPVYKLVLGAALAPAFLAGLAAAVLRSL